MSEDAAMLDLIRETTLYEITFIMNVGIREMLENAVANGNLSSSFASSEEAIKAKMDSFRSNIE